MMSMRKCIQVGCISLFLVTSLNGAEAVSSYRAGDGVGEVSASVLRPVHALVHAVREALPVAMGDRSRLNYAGVFISTDGQACVVSGIKAPRLPRGVHYWKVDSFDQVCARAGVTSENPVAESDTNGEAIGSGDYFHRADADQLSPQGLRNVRVLWIVHTEIERLGADFLKEFTGLRALVLESNITLQWIEPGFFNHCRHTLEYLRIAGSTLLRNYDAPSRGIAFGVTFPEAGFTKLKALSLAGISAETLPDLSKTPALAALSTSGMELCGAHRNSTVTNIYDVGAAPVHFANLSDTAVSHLSRGDAPRLPDERRFVLTEPVIVVYSGSRYFKAASGVDYTEEEFVRQQSFVDRLNEYVTAGGRYLFIIDNTRTNNDGLARQITAGGVGSVIRSRFDSEGNGRLAFQSGATSYDREQMARWHTDFEDCILSSILSVPAVAGSVQDLYTPHVRQLVREKREALVSPRRVRVRLAVSQAVRATGTTAGGFAVAAVSLALQRQFAKGCKEAPMIALVASALGLYLARKIEERANKATSAHEKRVADSWVKSLCVPMGEKGVIMTPEVAEYYYAAAKTYGAHLVLLTHLALLYAACELALYIKKYGGTALWDTDLCRQLLERISTNTGGIIAVTHPGDLLWVLQSFAHDKSVCDLARMVTVSEAYTADGEHGDVSYESAWTKLGLPAVGAAVWGTALTDLRYIYGEHGYLLTGDTAYAEEFLARIAGPVQREARELSIHSALTALKAHYAQPERENGGAQGFVVRITSLLARLESVLPHQAVASSTEGAAVVQ